MDIDIDEDKLFDELKTLPDFGCLPLPARWFKKYNIPPVEICTVKEYLQSNYTVGCMFAPKDLPPIIINEPQRDLSGNIKTVRFIETEPIPVEVVSKPYEPDKPKSD
jgi:hypothetical protein